MIRAFSAEADFGAIETCIIGSGPAGITLALELARLGRPSVMLESGVDAASAAQDLSRAEIVDPARHDDMSIAVARRFGGASNLWGGRSMPLDPVDFAPRAFCAGARWPIDHAAIAPWYETACRYTTCGAPTFDAPLPDVAVADDEFSFTSVERASNRPKFQKAHAAALAASPLIDIRLGATVVDLEFEESGVIAAALVAGPDGARHRILAQRFVIAAGGLETARLLMIAQRRRPDAFGGPDGPLGRYYMGHIIGEIADVTFADDRFDAAFDFLKDGAGSYVRRRFVPRAQLQDEHRLPNICFWPVVPPIADPRHGSGALSAVALALSTPVLGPALIPEAIRTRHLGGAIDWAPHLRNVVTDGPRTAAFLTRFVRERYLSEQRIPGYFVRNRARRYGLSYHSEQSPRADSRVTLSDERDALGAPRLRIDLRFHREDAEAVVRAHDLLRDWVERAGVARIDYRQPPEANVEAVARRMSHGTHQIGTARMGVSRTEGVVDGDLRCFDAPNLYVASSAVFPTSGQANPTLSIVAFAARLADHLARDSAKIPMPTTASAHAQ
jgi:choline dehydrogenase-like flavoprotein